MGYAATAVAVRRYIIKLQIDSFKAKDFKSNDNSVLQKRRGGGGGRLQRRTEKKLSADFFSLRFASLKSFH